MSAIAVHLETTPERVSFIDLVRLLRHGLDRVAVAAIVINPNRPAACNPAWSNARPLQYSRMTQPRYILKRELMKQRGPQLNGVRGCPVLGAVLHWGVCGWPTLFFIRDGLSALGFAIRNSYRCGYA